MLAALQALADPGRATHSSRFFKTGPGEYGEGDRFFGVTVPVTRKLAFQNTDLDESDLHTLLHSEYHEARLLALVILVERFRKSDAIGRRQIYEFYMNQRSRVNNWDLVDVSAPTIVGGYLEGRSRKVLFSLARSRSLWDRRIAVLATFHFIRSGDFDDALEIFRGLLGDAEDLVHKAVGWMLREIGKRDREQEEVFLREHMQQMPRTMLRYAIEKFPPSLRQCYLAGKVTE